jgi:hypothetical protein
MRLTSAALLMLPLALGGCVYIETTGPAAPPPRVYYYGPPTSPPAPEPPTQPIPLRPR